MYAGTPRRHTGDEVAENYWNMVDRRDRVETVLGDPQLFAAYEELVCLGLAAVFPPPFTGELPKPENERDRNLQLVSAFHVRSFLVAKGEMEEALAPLNTIVRELGGNPDLPLYGGNLDAIYPSPPLR
ncbi:hypothetical protein [Nocardia aurea]|uniref:hypothetical protein n=1 Tax=Nocardia aurea TaxID=2144174 RepID=UPI001300ADC8|nr:hypothetical protein [Nocardia aurea]